MTIIHKIEDFLFTIFPNVDVADIKSIENALTNYYSYGIFKPKVTIEDGWVKIEIDTSNIVSQESDYRKVVSLCEKRQFSEAKPILTKLINVNPSVSEYHRIMGQILSELGYQDEAINFLIDAIRWDAQNSWALLMMGNIFAKYRNDVPTAMKYYDQSLKINPADNITRNNIGANLMQQGKIQEAKKYFLEAKKIDPNYPNTHFAMGLIAEMENDISAAFDNIINSIKLNKHKDDLFNNSVNQSFKIAKKIISSDAGKTIIKKYLVKLEIIGGKEIFISEDLTIPTAAKIEFAENYNKDLHVVKYNSNYPAYEHLVMHELVHLDFVLQARKAGLNQLFISNSGNKELFLKNLEIFIRKLKKNGYSEKSVADYCTGLFEGLNRQIFNVPIDLFIEDFLHNEFPDLRAYQYLSLFNLINESVKAVTDKMIVEISPSEIVSKSKILNLVHAFQFRELYGVDITKEFKSTPLELNQANEFYQEYLQYKHDRHPGEEYELVQHWAEDLKLDKYFELIGEEQYRKRFDLDDFLESLEKDPYGFNEKDPVKDREMKKFIESSSKTGTNMAVVMYMVDALKFFEGMPKEETKGIAMEIAMQGIHGYIPDKDYILSSIPDKKFTGFHILAYFYVSWAIIKSESLSQLQLPYADEFELAMTIYKSK